MVQYNKAAVAVAALGVANTATAAPVNDKRIFCPPGMTSGACSNPLLRGGSPAADAVKRSGEEERMVLRPSLDLDPENPPDWATIDEDYFQKRQSVVRPPLDLDEENPPDWLMADGDEEYEKRIVAPEPYPDTLPTLPDGGEVEEYLNDLVPIAYKAKRQEEEDDSTAGSRIGIPFVDNLFESIFPEAKPEGVEKRAVVEELMRRGYL